MTTLLLDDERTFADNRECLLAKSTDEAIALTENLNHIDELWLDYVLKRSDSTDEFLRHLVARKRQGNPLTISQVYIHTSAYMAISLLKQYLSNLGINEDNVHVVDHTQYMVTL